MDAEKIHAVGLTAFKLFFCLEKYNMNLKDE